MLTTAERAEAERQSLQRCADFETVLTEIIYGFDPGTPSHSMTRDQIYEFVRNQFGPLFVTFCEQMNEFKIH
jgi:hypothetical protein